MNAFLAAGGGFLLAVLWMDLMFDVLALGRRSSAGVGKPSLPEESLAQIACYYRRVTTMASPMHLLISAVMAAMVGVLVFQLVRGDAPPVLAAASLGLCAVPIALALLRVFPSAIRLGTRADSAAEQSRLARAIGIDHIACFAAMLVFVVLRLFAAP